jgi:hypothetical protein
MASPDATLTCALLFSSLRFQGPSGADSVRFRRLGFPGVFFSRSSRRCTVPRTTNLTVQQRYGTVQWRHTLLHRTTLRCVYTTMVHVPYFRTLAIKYADGDNDPALYG